MTTAPPPTAATIGAALRRRAERHPDAPALVLLHEDGSRELVSADELYREARSAAAGLAGRGIAAGDVVVLLLGHSRQLIVGFLGALYRGAVPSVFPAYLTDETDIAPFAWRIAAMLSAIAPGCVVTFPSHVAAVSAMIAGAPCPVLSSAELTASAPPPAHDARPEDVAFLQFTSGSGGMPKGVLLTHRAVLGHIEAKRLATAYEAQELVVSWLPLYHDLGLISGLLTPLVLGHRTVMMSPSHWVRSPHILLRTIHEFRATITGMPNFGFSHSVRAVRERDLEGIDLSCVRTWATGGEPARLTTHRQFAERFGRYGFRESMLRSGYGAAELLEAVTTTAPDTPPPVDWIDRPALQGEGVARAVPVDAPTATPMVSCGTPIPGAEVRIVDARSAPVAERRIGEIAVRSDYMFDGYYRQPELTRAALRDGFFYTGDLGYLADGQLYVTGRKSDLIIVGGRNVHPEDVESIADRVAGLRPGRSVAIGVADAGLGTERLVLICEAAPETSPDQQRQIERELRQQVKRELELVLGDVRFAPRGWVLKTSSGKTARTLNRDKYVQEMAGRSDASRGRPPG